MAAFARTLKSQVRYYSAPADMAIPASKQKFIPTSGTYPKGFSVSGTHVGVKASNTKFPDLALISSETPCSAAAVFTTNKFQAAPVQVSRDIIQSRQGQGIRSVVINTGSANAVTGKGGLEDATSMGKTVDELNGLNEPSTLVMSTGVIGQRYGQLASMGQLLIKQTPNLKNPRQNPYRALQSLLDPRRLANNRPCNPHNRHLPQAALPDILTPFLTRPHLQSRRHDQRRRNDPP